MVDPGTENERCVNLFQTLCLPAAVCLPKMVKGFQAMAHLASAQKRFFPALSVNLGCCRHGHKDSRWALQSRGLSTTATSQLAGPLLKWPTGVARSEKLRCRNSATAEGEAEPVSGDTVPSDTKAASKSWH